MMTDEQFSLRQSATWGVIAFGVALAVVIGVRLEQAALAVLVGVVCGVAASIPTGVLIVSLLRRRDVRAERKEAGRDRSIETQSPPVVVVAPPNAAQLPHPQAWSEGYAASLPARRKFSVIGEEGVEDEFDDW